MIRVVRKAGVRAASGAAKKSVKLKMNARAWHKVTGARMRRSINQTNKGFKTLTSKAPTASKSKSRVGKRYYVVPGAIGGAVGASAAVYQNRKK